jgi:hypothetical protein
LNHRDRRGSATVEAAIFLPLLTLLTLGTIDIGQFVDLGQTVTSASRDGARLAARDSTTSVDAVEECIREYLYGRFAHISEETLDAAISIEILDENGLEIQDGDLNNVPSASRISVEVSFEYSAIRWINAPGFLINDQFTATTFGRRE